MVRRVIHLDDYLPTPGDVYQLVIDFGANPMLRDDAALVPTQRFSVVLQRDYTLELPYIGQLNTEGLSYLELRSQIIPRIRQRALAEYVSFDLSAPAEFDVFVWGNVAKPGYYTVDALMRITDVIAMGGGQVNGGTRRRVVVKNNGTEQEYDMLRHIRSGELDQNPLLIPGDRVHIPPAGRVVQLTGAVRVPGSYEILPDETLADVIEFAGGLTPTAQMEKLRFERLNGDNRYATYNVGDTPPDELVLEDGDMIAVPSSTTTSETITVEGAVFTSPAQEGSPRSVPLSPVLLDIPYTPGMTVLSLLETLGGPTPFAQEQRSYIIRGETGERLPIPDLATIWTERRYDRDIVLRPGDYLVVPQQDLNVRVTGLVNAPGTFRFISGYSVADYLTLAGGIEPENGSHDRIYFQAPDGELTDVAMNTPVPPGTTVFVDRNIWGGSKQFFTNVFVVTGWITGIISAATAVINFIQVFSTP